MSKQLKNVSHDYIRYANCWEDADILLQALKTEPKDRVLSIGSAGDNSFSILIDNPELVVAVDINAVQLNLIELKKAAFKELNYLEFLQFLGFNDCDDRWQLFLKLKKSLSPELTDFWTTRRKEVENGLIYQGKFERYFQLFHQKILPLIHNKKRITQLFEQKTLEQQVQFFNKKWNNWRWRMLFRLFFSKFVMGRLGRDPKFLKEVEIPVSTFILQQAKKHLSAVECQNNYFLQFILTGKFNTVPHYAREENFEKIKSNVDNLVVFHGLAEDAFKEHQDFNKFNLSNIFEYMDDELFKTVCENLASNARSKSKFAYWNLLVPRKMSVVVSEIEQIENADENYSSKDKGFFYSKFNVSFKP